ncbi:MAG: septum formation initiator family protein [Clostridiales bacterium]|jgi:cell division protein FtsB|nr:septum formation initiator family protein [Clostridiales bacterium]
MAQRYSKYDDSYNRYLNGIYSNTSSAVVLEPVRKEDTRPFRRERTGTARPVEKRRAPQPVNTPPQKTVKQQRGHVTTVDIDIARKNHKGLIRTGALAMVLGLAFLCILSYARTDERRLRLDEMQAELNRIKTINVVLENEIMNNFNLEEIEAFARNELGMVDPEESQFIYVDDPRVSYSERYDAPEDNEGKGGDNIFTSLAGLIGIE